ncbi:FAD-binding oxidoreductase [Psychrosphaera sp. 1_MG-2023]|uniref:NAD(P)/FAD-dependent oxidoreductase n=1 Tax=Psychrosphaera sp. 1_MG-2023 TaxID=3062643 RepID=UPI0026E3CF32|nr:FAD-binding oxidoreductase [Psychrosphaera sp. 1_MG-2023]MDO6719340.1 FAD-binding oxidoreductase [Psychrosphaera sp. 1_MG-2023]
MAVYDPLLSKQLASNQSSPQSYWHKNYVVGAKSDTKILNADINADVVIIGAGYTGLTCAINLVQQGFKNIVILDANEIGWGCSGRNAGFVLPGSGRLSYQQLVGRFGSQATSRLHNDFLQGINLVEEIGKEYDIGQCESGYLKLAHSEKWYDRLKKSADYLHQNFDYNVETINKQAFQNDYVCHQKIHGAIRYSNGFGIHPLKLVHAYAQKAQSLGIKIYTNSSVTQIQSDSNHRVTTHSGSVTAGKLVMATNGYTPSKMASALQHKILPVLTSVIVTEPLTNVQREAANFKTRQVMMDTRELKYYYRLLPDNRILFGGRGAITGAHALDPKYANRLLHELKNSFPGLEKLNIDHNWHGWISVSLDQMPHIHKTKNNVYYATGYCGSGVSFTALAGKQLADLIVGKDINSPLSTELPHFPFAPFRRLGQRAYYQLGRLKDAIG